MNQLVSVEGMTCSGCANTVQTAFEGLEEIQSVNIDLAAQTAFIETDNELTINQLNDSLIDTNYSVTSITNG